MGIIRTGFDEELPNNLWQVTLEESVPFLKS